MDAEPNCELSPFFNTKVHKILIVQLIEGVNGP